ncbi:MAG: histidine--tRNA ligase, partial [Chitinophagaceae bacterium]
PSLPQGTRDFGPEVVRKRQYILNTIRGVFELYGFQPLETPAMENIETLMGKYGEEGDKLIFKILNNGLDHFSKKEQATEEFKKITEGKTTKLITERALKYDLTIPFARYVAMNHGQLTFPFKRYQMQPVWRADRPQKGRYREFYQCDADIVGSSALINEVEFVNIYNDVFTQLQISDWRLQINNRKVLKGIMEVCGVEKKEKQILVIIDKTDKIGLGGVKVELSKEEISTEKLEKLLQVYSFKDSNENTLSFLKIFLSKSEIGLQGASELEFVINQFTIGTLQSKIKIDLTLARGLEYYTGIIIEAKAPDKVKMGSIGGGGRYNDLTGLFGVPNIPGVGISFGIDRIYDVMEELMLFPEAVEQGTKVLFLNTGEEESKTAYLYLQQIRKKRIAAEIFPEPVKLDKQYKYAEKKNIPFVITITNKETETNFCVVKNIRTGEQKNVAATELENFQFI